MSSLLSDYFDPVRVYMNTDGLMKLIRSLSDMAVRSCVVGEKGCVIVVDGVVVGVELFMLHTACEVCLKRKAYQTSS